ncbi:hypothetical protein Tco_0963534 [Tanacetum coccineum]
MQIGGISNFTGRIKGMHVFIGNFTYLGDFMIIEDISSIIDPRLSQVVLGRPFIEISNMTHDLHEGVVRFTYEDNDIAYKMPYKIEQYNSLLNLEKEHTKSVYLRNDEDKKRGVEYVMSKILGFYKECLELRPEYLIGIEDKREVTLYLMRRSLEVLRKFHWTILGGRFNQLSHVSSSLLSKQGEFIFPLSVLTGKKAHLLEDKQIPSVGVFDKVYFALGRHLDELHVTWAHLEKKRMRLRTNTMTLEDLCSQSRETASQGIHDTVTPHLVTASPHFEKASAHTDLNADLEDLFYDGVTTKMRRCRIDFLIYTNLNLGF